MKTMFRKNFYTLTRAFIHYSRTELNNITTRTSKTMSFNGPASRLTSYYASIIIRNSALWNLRYNSLMRSYTDAQLISSNHKLMNIQNRLRKLHEKEITNE